MNLQEALTKGTQILQTAGVQTAVLDAAVLLEHVTGASRLDMITAGDKEVSPADVAAYEALVARRCKHEPVAYLTGEKEFWGYKFKVREGVLIPRPDSETLVATLLTLLPNKQIEGTIAELGVGSGALILSLLKECSNLKGFGTDVSDDAFAVTGENAMLLGVHERLQLLRNSAEKPWASVLPDKVNIIISNPPYIATDEVKTLDADVQNYEPHLALDGGADGLDCYRALIPTAYEKLIGGGLLLLEIGYTQAKDVQALLPRSQWAESKVFKDLAGRDRVIAAVRTL